MGSNMRPSIGRIVHYRSFGTPGGEYTPECRAAIVTELTGTPDHPDRVGLCVLNPTGQFFDRSIDYDDGQARPGDPLCPNAPHVGGPHRYCACGWMEASYRGGTWHWPGRVD
jgi:hypothetical protein